MRTSGKFLLDTNIVTALLAGESSIVERLEEAGQVYLPSIVLGELYYGARKSSRSADNMARLDEFAAACAVLDCGLGTAREYGAIKHRLSVKGRPIPENDIWIAALALEHELTLVTRDRHFGEVDNLSQTAWQ